VARIDVRDLGRGLFAALLALAAVPAAAESGGIEVRVYDAAGKSPVAGASVTLSSTLGMVATTTLVTKADGLASFPVLRPSGGYVVEADFPGFARVRITDIRVKIQEVTRVPIRLVSEIRENVKVVERRAEVDLDKTSRSTTLDDSFLQDLPSQGRTYQSRLVLAPGVVDLDGDGNPNVHGARASEFQAQVGGVSNQDPLTGGWMSNIVPDSIEEIEVIGAGAGVEFGRAQGGFAQVIEKQGANEFEGLANLLWRSSRMDGGAEVGKEGVRAPEYDWIQPSLQVSGPIVKDRLWFRFSHEYISREAPVTALDGTVVAAQKRGLHSDQITWQVSPRNKLALEIRNDPYTETYKDASTLTAADSTTRYESGGPAWSLNWTAPASPNILVDTVVSHQNGYQRYLPMVTGIRNDCTEGFYLPEALKQSHCTDTDTGMTSGPYSKTEKDRRQRLTVKSQASIFGGRFLGMTHQIKVGIDVENERYFRHMEQRPEMSLSISEGPYTMSGHTFRAQYATVSVQVASPHQASVKATDAAYGFFVEDQVKPLSNLSLTAGFRVDREETRGTGYQPFDPAAEAAEFVRRLREGYDDGGFSAAAASFTSYGALRNLVQEMSSATGISDDVISQDISSSQKASQQWAKRRRPADLEIANTNVSPRFSLAWDPGGEGKSKLALTVGRYYGTIPLAVPLVEEEPVTTTMALRAMRIPPDPTWTTPRFLPGIDPAVSSHVVDRGLRTPYQDEVTISLEHEIARETIAKLSYVSRRFRDQLRDVDINHYHADYGRCVLQTSADRPWIVGPPDGILDDCDGTISVSQSQFGGTPAPAFRQPDGYLDSYVYNPGWGAVYQITNNDTARYKGIVLEVVRRQFRNWQMQGSYTWSRVVGDAEEFSTFNPDPANRDSVGGYLAYDVRHVVKLNATTITPWGFRLGTSANWMSGLPYSIVQVASVTDSMPLDYPSGFVAGIRQRTRYASERRNDRRNRPSLTVNVKLDKEYNLRSGQNLQLALEVFNLLNDRNYEIYNTKLGYGRQTNGQNDAMLTAGREFQLGFRLAF
jgi:hypothetical protein